MCIRKPVRITGTAEYLVPPQYSVTNGTPPPTPLNLKVAPRSWISWVIERWRSDKQARDLRGHGHCIDSFKIFRLQQDKIIANMYFLMSFYCSEWNRQEIRTI